MIDQDRLAQIDDLIRWARAAGRDDIAAEALSLLASVVRSAAADARVQRDSADAMTRAHARAREPGAPRQPRKGRDRCSATRRDGQPCQAPAIPGGVVCRRHGGATRRAAIKAAHTQLLVAQYAATMEYREARGTPREFDALCRALAAGRAVEACEAKLRLIAELRAEVKRRRAGSPVDAGDPIDSPPGGSPIGPSPSRPRS